MMGHSGRPQLAGCAALALGLAFAPRARAESRGELLYTTHCIACHTTQIHWRDNKQATDWPSLLVQVRRWQTNTSQAWTEDDILQVARHLNDSIYRFPRPLARQSLMVSLPAIAAR